MKRARFSRAFAAAAAIVAVMALSLLALLPSEQSDAPSASVASTEPRGRRAAFLLLESLGFAPRAWSERPGLLPRGAHVLFLPPAPREKTTPKPSETDERDDGGELEPSEPVASPPVERAPDPLQVARARGLGAPRHYRAFVENGGTLIAPWGEAERDFLVEEAGFAELADLELAPESVQSSRASIARGAALEIDWSARPFELPSELAARATPLLFTDEGHVLALEMELGAGRVVLFDDDAFLENRTLGEKDCAVLLVRLVERYLPEDGSGLVLFDEHRLGVEEAVGPLVLAFGPSHRALSVNLLLALCVFAWHLAWVREFPRDPEPLEQLSPLSRARAEAGLFIRAGRVGALADRLRAHELRWLAARLRLRSSAAEAGERSGVEARGAELERLAAESAGSFDLARWREALLERDVRTPAELEALDRDLRGLEVELTPPSGRMEQAQRTQGQEAPAGREA